MSDEQPTMWEVMRTLTTVAKNLENLSVEMREDRKHAAATFLRRDVWDEARKADKAVVSEVDSEVDALKADRKRNDDFRRQVALGSALAALALLGSFGVAIFSLLAGGAS